MADVDLNACPLAAFDELLTEQVACERFSHLLSDRELREARRKGKIKFITGKKGQILYRPRWLADYMNGKITPCDLALHASGNTEVLDRPCRWLRLSLCLLVGQASRKDAPQKSCNKSSCRSSGLPDQTCGQLANQCKPLPGRGASDGSA